MKRLGRAMPFVVLALVAALVMLAERAMAPDGTAGSLVAVLVGALGVALVSLPTAGRRFPGAAWRVGVSAILVVGAVVVALLLARLALGRSPEATSPSVIAPAAACVGGLAFVAWRTVGRLTRT